MARDINVIALVKGDEKYIVMYEDRHKQETLRQLGRWAANPDMSFTWYDAAVLCERIRQTPSGDEFPMASRFGKVPK